ncbi:MAG: hypothetical protein ACKVPJ_13475 [Chitinophagales bacterium]
MKNDKKDAPVTVEQKDKTALEVVKSETPKTEVQLPPFMRVVKSVKENFQLLNQWEKLDETEKELDNFTFGGDKLKEAVTIKDSEGHQFNTSNTELIRLMTDVAKNYVSEKKADIAQKLEVAQKLAA